MTTISRVLNGASAGLFGASLLVLGCSSAWAGIPTPAPLAGALGPLGLLAAGVGYGGYRLVKHLRKRR
ncbi:MAG TPA: hypothetical protein VLL50_01705 [Usitatibacter sp.]|nr:hypothetical protein [Usitatibacter sp.]